MKIKALGVIITILFFSVSAYSQANFKEGYIIDIDNDTLYGKVKDRTPEPFSKLYKKIRFKEEGGPPLRFSVKQIKAYKKGEEFYESMWFYESSEFFMFRAYSIPGKGRKEFIRVAYKDYLSYYLLEFEDESGIDYRGYFKRKNETEMVFVRTTILGLNKKRLINYFKDCKPLQEKIASGAIKNPYEITTFYNKWYKEQR